MGDRQTIEGPGRCRERLATLPRDARREGACLPLCPSSLSPGGPRILPPHLTQIQMGGGGLGPETPFWPAPRIHPAAVARDGIGEWTHPSYPEDDVDPTVVRAWLRSQGCDSAFVSMQAVDHGEFLLTRMMSEQHFRFWEPPAPPGEGWFLFLIRDPGEGPFACFARHVELDGTSVATLLKDGPSRHVPSRRTDRQGLHPSGILSARSGGEPGRRHEGGESAA